MNIVQRPILDWRTRAKFGLAQYGAYRVLMLGKLCVFLWRVV